MGVGHQPDGYVVDLSLSVVCIYIFCSIFDLVIIFYFLANEADEVLDEEARIKEVINYPIHAYLDLVTPARLHQCGFGPDPDNLPFLTSFVVFSSLFLEYSLSSCQLLTPGSFLV